MKTVAVLFLILFSVTTFSQTEVEVVPPYNIKTATFVQSNENVVPIFELGAGFQFQFDDLFGNEANYYYEIVHCDYNWKPTDIPKNEYLKGFDGQRIQEYQNSFNTCRPIHIINCLFQTSSRNCASAAIIFLKFWTKIKMWYCRGNSLFTKI